MNINTNKPEISTIFRKGCIATVAAVVINAALYLMGSTFTFPADAITPTGDPVTVAPVILASILGGLVATISYFLLTRFLARVTANRVMWVLTGVVLIGMFFTPFGIENVPIAQIVILEIMHFVAALPVWWLTRS
ncbi:MAG: DUF6069 family protein [Cyanobacteria bacterium P01_H01_bin.119]